LPPDLACEKSVLALRHGIKRASALLMSQKREPTRRREAASDLLPLNAPFLGRVRSLREMDMRKSRFTEEQIIKVLKEHAAGLSAGELCRKYGISDATFYKWRSRYGGMEISDARRLKALEDENRRLKKLLAESMLDASTLKEMLGKNF